MLVEEDEKDKDLLKMTVGGIQPAQEVKVTIVMIKKLEIEAGAYCLRIPTTYFIKYGNASTGAQVNVGIPAKEVDATKGSEYTFRVDIATQEPVTFVSVPSHAKVTKITKDAS